jgi:hypothetical protein
MNVMTLHLALSHLVDILHITMHIYVRALRLHRQKVDRHPSFLGVWVARPWNGSYLLTAQNYGFVAVLTAQSYAPLARKTVQTLS